MKYTPSQSKYTNINRGTKYINTSRVLNYNNNMLLLLLVLLIYTFRNQYKNHSLSRARANFCFSNAIDANLWLFVPSARRALIWCRCEFLPPMGSPKRARERCGRKPDLLCAPLAKLDRRSGRFFVQLRSAVISGNKVT
jgi:hypothetical protein